MAAPPLASDTATSSTAQMARRWSCRLRPQLRTVRGRQPGATPRTSTRARPGMTGDSVVGLGDPGAVRPNCTDRPRTGRGRRTS